MKHKFSRRLGALALALVLALSCAVSPAWAAAGPNVTSIIFGQLISITLPVGQSTRLEPTSASGNVSAADDVTWFNNGKDFVTLDNDGTVTAISPGSATIRATSKSDGTFARCTITVVPASSAPITVTGVNLNKTHVYLKVGETETLTASVFPSNADQTIVWSTYPDGIVTVVDGKVTATAVGTTTITAAAWADPTQSKTCEVIVSAADPSLKLPTTLFLELGHAGAQLGTLEATVTGTIKKVTWESDNSDVIVRSANNSTTATVTTTSSKATTANIKVTVEYDLGDGKTTSKYATCRVTVADGSTGRVTDINLNRDKVSLVQGATFQLTATLTPSNAASTAVEWTTSNSAVADVNPTTGLVTAKSAGEATITATPVYGDVSTTCTVTVTPAATGINLVPNGDVIASTTGSVTKYTLTYGRNSRDDNVIARANLTPSNSEDSILWQSSDATVATVSGTGTSATITRKGAGTAKITAVPVGPDGKPREGVKAAELDVTVSGIKLKSSTFTIAEYRQSTLEYEAYGDAQTNGVDWQFISSNPGVVNVDEKTGALLGRTKGSASITVTKGTGRYYTASCTVNVVEDTSGLITLTGNHPAGSPVNMSTASATSQAGSGTLASVLEAVCREKTKVTNPNGTFTTYGLQYVTNLSVASTDQGILHDQHHSSSDTGAGVGIQDIYYPNGNASQGQRSLKDLSFVPRTSFSGTAEINYTGRSTNNQSFSGIIRVTVNGTGDVMYASSEGSVVTFQADDFNLYHPSLSSVSFTPPLDSRGTLYYNYTSASQPGTKVKASDTYNRTGTPSLDRVSFVPASGYEGTVTISYKGKDTAGRSITGTVTISVTNNKGGSGAVTDIYYAAASDSWVTFRPSDFSSASRYALGETLSYVRFTPPPSNEGTLFYNYRGFGNYDGTVASTTSYYYNGTPSLGGVTFVPTTTTPSTVEINYTGYTTRGNTFTGTIHIGEDASAQQGGLRYTVFTGKSVYFNANDFNTACVAATGASLNYVLFSPLPAVGEGTLRYTRGTNSTPYNVSTSTRCYRTSSSSWDTQLNYVSFLASNSFVGTVTIPFTGYNTNNTSFTGEVVVTVTPPTSGDSVYYGTTASPIRLSSSRMRSACSDVLSGTLSYITFTSLPSSSAGRLYLGYSSFSSSGTPVNTGTRYYVSGSPGIDQISFVPRGRYSGQLSVPYTATNTNGQSVTGLITFNISNTGSSSYFNDMGGHSWAAPSVDYLYQNGVTNGITPTSYGPNQRILRRDFVLMLCRAFRFSGSGYSFADVPTNAYYADAVAAAKQRGIVSGDGRNFMPNSEITRQDAMVMIKNAVDAAGWNMGNASTSILGRFPDGTSVSSYARDAVSTLVQMGAVNGDNGMLYPRNSITRAEAAVILHFVMTM